MHKRNAFLGVALACCALVTVPAVAEAPAKAAVCAACESPSSTYTTG